MSALQQNPQWVAVEIRAGALAPVGLPPGDDGFRFFVQVIDADGYHITAWDGPSYRDALDTAEALRTDFRVEAPVADLTGGGE